MDFLYSYKQINQHLLLASDRHKRIWNDTYSILITIEGKSELTINDTIVMLYPGSVTFCNKDCFLEFNVIAGHDLNLYILSFHILSLMPSQPIGKLKYEEYLKPWRDNGPVYGISFYRTHEIVKELIELDELEPEQAHFTKQALLYELLPSIEHDQPTGFSTDSLHHSETIQQVINYIYQHYQDNLTRDGMAKFAGFHPRFFSKIFKEETNLGFTEYVANIRIHKAKEQLLLTELNLNKIAANVGYSNGLYLSRKFKQITGVSPKAYLNKPKRIVIYDWVGNVLALGIKPIGASYFYSLEHLHILKDLLHDIVDVGSNSIDNVIELNPELIIAPKWLGSSMLNKLSKVAPTIVVPYGDSFERFLAIAHTLRKEQEAGLFIQQYQNRAKAVRAKLDSIISPEETIGLYELSPSRTIWILNEFHGRGGYNLYRGMGFTPPSAISEQVIGKDMIKELNPEQLPHYAGDHMIISYPFEEESKEYAEAIMSHPIWKGIPAYQKNRIYFIDKKIFHPNDVLSLYRQLDLQLQLILNHKRDESHPCIFVHEKNDLMI